MQNNCYTFNLSFMFKSKFFGLEQRWLFTLLFASGFLSATAETWKPFTLTGTYAIQYIGEQKSVQNFYIANPLAPPFSETDLAAVKMAKNYNYVYGAWKVTHEGSNDMSFRNTQGGINTGDLIVFSSKIRTAPNYNVKSYRANQTFKIWQDVDIKDGIVCAIQSNNPAHRFWFPSSSSTNLAFHENSTKEASKVFKLIPLYKFADIEKQISATLLILKDTDKTYPADKRIALENALKAIEKLIKIPSYKAAEADKLLETLRNAYKEYVNAGKNEPVASLEKLTEVERRTKTSISLLGQLNAEDFRILRDEMVSLQEMDLSAIDNTEIPTFALAGHWKLERVVLPAKCEKIGKGAFMSCPNIKEIDFGTTITEIGTMAFWRSGLELVNIPAQVKTIGDFAFDECNELKAINVSEANPNYSSADGILYDKNKQTLFKCPAAFAGMLKLPETVTTIQDFACSNALHVTGQLVLPQKLENIGNYAFENCQNISDQLNLPATVKNIGKEAFWGCLNLSSTLSIPEKAKVDEKAFGYLFSLQDIVLPQSLEALPDGLFTYCKNVKNITTSRKEPAKVGKYVFWGWNMNDVYLHIPASAVDTYKATEGWKPFFAEKVKKPTRFTTNGKYYIQYIGKGVNKNKYLIVNEGYNQLAQFTSKELAPLWDFEFFEGKGISGAFNDGQVSDLRYSSDNTHYAHVNMQGLSFIDEKSNYSPRINRQFTFWIDEMSGNVAIQSNGYYFTASPSEAFIKADAYKGLPRLTDYVFRIIPQQTKINVSELGFTTFYTNFPLIIPAEVNAYSGKLDKEKQMILLNPIEKIIPANTAVVIEAKKGAYTLKCATEEGQAVTNNDLKGNYAETQFKKDCSIYTLQQPEDSSIGFYLDEDLKVPAHNAYLNLEKVSSPISGFPFTKDDLTGIEHIAVNADKTSDIYSLNGKKLQKISRSGIYLVNGKKVLILK